MKKRLLSLFLIGFIFLTLFTPLTTHAADTSLRYLAAIVGNQTITLDHTKQSQVINVDNSVSEVKIDAAPSDSSAYFWADKTKFEENESQLTIRITVVGTDNSTSVYTVTAKKGVSQNSQEQPVTNNNNNNNDDSSLPPLIQGDNLTPSTISSGFLGMVLIVAVIVLILVVAAVLLYNTFTGNSRSNTARPYKHSSKRPLLSDRYRSYKYKK